ncbi:MAG: hypothetical protein RLZZ156_2174 [Deinococcota bacterium]|jgi:DNA polymerase III subunit gamma/tau
MTAMKRLRPIHWDEVVGQEHVKDVLRPALERGRIGHAYLFSGPRGVGKTTTARLIAMTVNCETAGVKPCGMCDSCKSVIAGRHPDVLEIDAASNNSVDDVRDLREKVALQPMRGDKKVYILDEAHMMSKSAFNALLKTLEEPPSHAVFVLATTEPERLPPTILSRCQHYRFRRLSSDEIAGKLLKTATAEGVNPSPQALNLIARAADGAMRDGESLLERLLSSGEPNLTLEMVEGALGLPPQDRVEALAFALARGDTKRLMQSLTAFYSDGFAPRTIVERAKIALRDQLHAQLGLSKNVSETFAEVQLLRLIKALDEEDGRFARSSDLIALEMAFTKAMLSPDSNNEAGIVSPALESRVTNLEKQVRGAFQKVVDDALKASGQRSPNQVPEFDPMARTPRRPAALVQQDDPPFEVPELRAEQTRVETPPSRGSEPVPSRGSEATQEPPRAASLHSKGWADVILKADLRFRAILKEAVGHLSADTLVIEYNNPKHKWHAEQVAGKLEELAVLTQQVIGQGIALELVMPDGTKKNSRTVHNPSTITSAARVIPAVLENLQPETPVISPEPEIPKSLLLEPEPNKSASRVALDTASRVASDLAFAALEPDEPVPPVEPVAKIEPDIFDDAPDFEEMPLPTEYGSFLNPEEILVQETTPAVTTTSLIADGSLETYDLESSADAPPLAALEMDFGDFENAVPTKVVSSLVGHPNYALVSKLFAHRVREVGQLELKTVVVEDDTTVVLPVLPNDDLE